MASADQLKALVDSFVEGDEQRFFSIAMQVAAHEAKLGHSKLATATLDAIAKWRTPKLSALDGQIAHERQALMPPPAPADPRALEQMAAQLQRFTPHEIIVLYGSASDAERVL